MSPSTSNSSKAAIAAVVAVAVVVIATLVLVQSLGGSGTDDPGATTAGDTPTEVPTDGTCNEPPALPEQPKQFDAVPPKSLAENTTWTATVHTNCGDIVMELDGKKAPQTVSSFISLAREGYWDASPCHRLTTAEVDGLSVLQCGDPTGTGSGNPGYGYGVENAPKDYQYPRGTLAMARTQDPDSNGGQFFVVYDQTELQDPTGYSVFGKVTSGLDIVDRIAEQGTGGTLGPAAPKQPISILSVDVEKAA
jgi:peptidyl-prolyl cis-trans isomerase B (cyclophilin B)